MAYLKRYTLKDYSRLSDELQVSICVSIINIQSFLLFIAGSVKSIFTSASALYDSNTGSIFCGCEAKTSYYETVDSGSDFRICRYFIHIHPLWFVCIEWGRNMGL